MIGIALALRYIPEIRMQRPSAFDMMGFIIIACGLGVAQFAIENLGRHTIDNLIETMLLLGAARDPLGLSASTRGAIPIRCSISGCFVAGRFPSPVCREA